MTRGRLAELSGRTRTLSLARSGRSLSSVGVQRKRISTQKGDSENEINNSIVRNDSYRGRHPGPASGKCGGANSLRTTVNGARPEHCAENIPDKKLDAAAAAVKSVSAVKDTFDQRLAKAPAGEKERLSGEAEHAMTKAVTDQGLSVEEYVTIMKVAQNDPIVRDKLIKRMK